MRNYKFRGKRLTGSWAYGCLLEKKEEYIKGRWQNIYAICMPETDLAVTVETKTVGQFTGLFDKNGVEIYEGDIIRFGGEIYNIEFGDGCFWIIQPCSSMEIHTIAGRNEIEVIGNIHED